MITRCSMQNEEEIIVKRLVLIKSLIELADFDGIKYQLKFLRSFDKLNSIAKVLELLELSRFQEAYLVIDDFVSSKFGLVSYIDPEINALKMEIKAVESELERKSLERNELEKFIRNFNLRHSEELGHLILAILELKKQNACSLDEKQAAEDDYQSYNKSVNEQEKEKIFDLSEKDVKNLRKLYREASKLCHPDVVEDNNVERAKEYFHRLTKAYNENDLNKVTSILNELKVGKHFKHLSETVSEKDLLIANIRKMRIKLDELTRDIDRIKNSVEYKSIPALENWEDYFEQKKSLLKEQYKSLKND